MRWFRAFAPRSLLEHHRAANRSLDRLDEAFDEIHTTATTLATRREEPRDDRRT